MSDWFGSQIGMFDGAKKFRIDKPIRLIELFAGIGAQAKALERLGVPFEHYRVCEFDKYAIKSYNAIHGTNFETSDVTQITADDLGIIDTNKYCYILTYSFPCTDLSIAGRQQGMSKNSGTRSGLLWEVERLLDECNELPQVLLMENVPQVHAEKNIADFNSWLQKLESLGYKSWYKDLNAKDFGVPQNRNRTFCVSLLGDYYYEFPQPKPLKTRLKDLLDKNVEEKYYISENNGEKCLQSVNAERERLATQLGVAGEGVQTVATVGILLSKQGKQIEKVVNIANTLMARDYKGFGNQATNGVLEWKK
jgi:DNA (cytosine-5)-methyltransferase 1|nr:MAG TPA: Cytosine specific methyltransferase [Caudoviricetes sp.]